MIKLLLAYSLAQCVLDKRFMTTALVKALVLAAFTWWLCGCSMWLWNRRFQLRLLHHAVCAFAAGVTLISMFLFECLGEIKHNALRDLKRWQGNYLSDRAFDWITFVQVSESLQQLYRQNGWEWNAHEYLDPPRDPPADPSKYRVPLDRPEARDLSLRLYCERTVQHLNSQEPVLAAILWKGSQIPREALQKDLADFRRDDSRGIYNYATGSLRIAGNVCLKKLEGEVSRQVLVLRVALIGLFLSVQLVAFGFAGHSAYSDLKLHH
jgi:hypothetical protein